jgi:hypothetical protein
MQQDADSKLAPGPAPCPPPQNTHTTTTRCCCLLLGCHQTHLVPVRVKGKC